eukprot:TRINITY_DN5091_c0_g1_i1.p1 TRINITY_DN5091_c0_g1~~TRINITY_DN5091_c0_g1_i1.p1  ORF type:complete len:231 (-),score=29.91 TRINITY_DN5091_c0_g1_i1:1321-2013(-)
MPRVPTRVGRAAGTMVDAARIVDQDCPRMRVSVFLSGVNGVGDIKWLVLHGTGMDDEPKFLRLEGQLQHARRMREGLVYAGAFIACPPADVIGDGVAVEDPLARPLASVPLPSVSLTPVAGKVVPSGSAAVGNVVGAASSPPAAAVGAGSSTFTDEKLLALDLPPVVEDGDVGNNEGKDGGSYWGSHNDAMMSALGGRNIIAEHGPVDLQPGVGALPPLRSSSRLSRRRW